MTPSETVASTAVSTRMPDLVKGAGLAVVGGNKPLSDHGEIFKRAHDAEQALYGAVKQGLERPDEVRKGISPAFQQEFGLFLQADPAASAYAGLSAEISSVLSAELGKNITLTSPLSSGLVPYDLVAPARLIYPVFSPLRNKFPRTSGQGTSRRVKAFTGITGSQTGGQTVARMTISELVSGSLAGTSWPNNLPGSGAQASVDMNIPYKFFGLSESLSWLSQFAGQGFEDISALANLILMQEFMMGEEYAMLAATGTSLAAPAAPTLAVRTAGANESALSGITTNAWVTVTAKNYYGATVGSTRTSIGWTAGQVVDVTIGAVRGALNYDVYIGSGAADPGNAGMHLMVSGVGGQKVTLQGGAIPTGTAVPPTADTGTGNANDYEGILSILDGHAVTDASIYPAGFQGGYVNKSVGKTLSHTVLFDALQHLWDGTSTTAEGFRASPSELLCEGSDARRLADDVLNTSNAGLNYRLSIAEGPDQSGVRVGAAVSEIQNPITRDTLALVVHPWLTQGTAFLLSYTLPHAFSHVSNVWENVLVQDYLSIQWPVIDASFRYSMFMYGALVCYAPQYNGVIQGLQQSQVTPYA